VHSTESSGEREEDSFFLEVFGFTMLYPSESMGSTGIS